MSSDSIWSTIINFIKSLFKKERKKCATDCDCKGCCCCESCIATVGYNEKGSSSDDSEEDIVITKNKVVIK